jgi:hypothetical protein
MRAVLKEEKPKYQNCWEYWKCPEDFHAKCPVFRLKDGKKCWIYTDHLKVFGWAKEKRSFDSCLECPWYRIVNKKYHL